MCIRDRYKILWPLIEGVLWAGFIYFYLTLAHQARNPFARALAFVGEISFSIYLLHIIVIELFMRLHIDILPSGSEPITRAVVHTNTIILPIVIVCAFATYHIIEKPFLTLRRAYLIKNDLKD